MFDDGSRLPLGEPWERTSRWNPRAGQAFLPGLRAGFAELERAISALRDHDCRGSLLLSVAPIFATKWLIPRLDRFRAAHPDIDARISATLELAGGAEPVTQHAHSASFSRSEPVLSRISFPRIVCDP